MTNEKSCAPSAKNLGLVADSYSSQYRVLKVDTHIVKTSMTNARSRKW